jgi:predicted phage terminase large subunit-like protein
LGAAANLESNSGLTLREFIRKVDPHFVFYPHLDALIDRLQDVADGILDRLMVFMPPRHGKSQLVSRIFTAYFLYRYARRRVILASYTARLAYALSRNARDNYIAAGGVELAKANEAEWENTQGGGLLATGVGGSATGYGADLFVIDDPVRSPKDAASENFRETQIEWYRGVAYTRLMPGAAIVIIQTRWHESDLSGWLLAQEVSEDEDQAPERWHVVNLPAIKEEPEEAQEFPSTCTVEPDNRRPGDALCAERYPLARLKNIWRVLGDYLWYALYGQRPRPLSGGMFKRSDFKIVKTRPNTFWRVRYWDKAASVSKSAKYTAGVLIAYGTDGAYYIEDVVRGQWKTSERREVMGQIAQMDAYLHSDFVRTYIEQEPGSSGMDSVYDEIRMLAGYAVFADRPSGDKDTRMLPLAAQAQVGNVYLVEGAWNDDFITELCALPTGRYRDQADAASGAFNRLIEITATVDNDAALAEAFGIGGR